MNIDDILSEVEANVPNVTDIAYTNAVTRGAARFFRESRVWQVTLDPISLRAGVSHYMVDAPRGASVSEFANVFYEGEEIYSTTRADLARMNAGNGQGCTKKYDREAGQLVLYPTPQNNVQNAVVIRAVVVPDIREESCTGLDYFIDKYGDGIVAAACVRLCKMPNKPWTNNNAASIYESEYLRITQDAQDEAKGFTEKRIIVARAQEY